jgi:hypothetical protein
MTQVAPPPPPPLSRRALGARPPPPPNPFVVLEEQFLKTDVGKQGMAAWDSLQVASAPMLATVAKAMQPSVDAAGQALQPILLPVGKVLEGVSLKQPGEPSSPLLILIVFTVLFGGVWHMMRRLSQKWGRRDADATQPSRFAARGMVADAEARGVQPLLGGSRVASRKASPRMNGNGLPLGGRPSRASKDSSDIGANGGNIPPPIRIGIPSGTPCAGAALPTARGNGGGAGGRFLRTNSPMSSARSQTPRVGNADATGPPSARGGVMMRPDWLDAVGRRGPQAFGEETPQLSRPSTTPRAVYDQQMETPAPGDPVSVFAPASAYKSGWAGGCASRMDGAESTALLTARSSRSMRSGRSTPRIESLMCSTPRLVSWQGVNPHHKLQIAFEPVPADWDGTETARPAERMLSTYLPPVPPRIMPVDEIFFVLHKTGMELPSPLPDWAHEWVRNAILFGRLLSNNQLRTRDIYGLKEQESVFELQQFVIHVPMELNPHLSEDINVTQDLFRLGSCQMPDKKQIIFLPTIWAQDAQQGEEEGVSTASEEELQG